MSEQRAPSDEAQPGPTRWRVARVDKGAIRAIPDDGVTPLPTSRTWRTSPDGTLAAVVGEPLAPAVGDWLHVHDDIVRLAPRVSELRRDSAGTTSAEQVLAANVDTVIIAEPLEPLPALGRIERLLTLAHRSGAAPVVILTKADLVDDDEYWAEQVRHVVPGVEVQAVSASTGAGVGVLHAALADATTLVLLGPSGAGKSTLVNALAGSQVMATGQVRGDSRGRHTTTHRELVPLGNGQMLIDTPGLRSIGLVASAESVAATFSDVESLAADCRFTDCAHDREPDCAVQEAVETGDLPERRLDSWRSLHREVERQAARVDARLAAERGRQVRRAAKSARAARSRARR